MKLRQLLPLGLIAMPFLVLTTSYVLLSFNHGRLNILNEVVHENGRYTLIETIFYFGHFSREIIICVMTSLAVAFSFYLYAPITHSIDDNSVQKTTLWGVTICAVFVFWTVSGAAFKTGIRDFWLDFLQYRTTDTGVLFGSHWHSHFLHLLQIFVAAIGLSQLYRGVTGLSNVTVNPGGFLYILGWVGLFLFFSLIFRTDLRPFTDTRYLAHQMREIVTHLTVTLPLAFAALITIENKLIGFQFTHSKVNNLTGWGLFLLTTSLLVPAFILVQLHGRNIMSVAQKHSGYLDLFASHYFEHVLDYFFVAVLSAVLYVSLITRRASEKRF